MTEYLYYLMVFTYYYLGERDEPITICCSRAPTLAEKKGMSACAWRVALAYKCIDSCACRVRDPLSSHLRIWELIIRVLLWLSVLVVTFRIGFAVEIVTFGVYWWAILFSDLLFLIDIVVSCKTGFMRGDGDEHGHASCMGLPCYLLSVLLCKKCGDCGSSLTGGPGSSGNNGMPSIDAKDGHVIARVSATTAATDDGAPIPEKRLDDGSGSTSNELFVISLLHFLLFLTRILIMIVRRYRGIQFCVEPPDGVPAIRCALVLARFDHFFPSWLSS